MNTVGTKGSGMTDLEADRSRVGVCLGTSITSTYELREPEPDVEDVRNPNKQPSSLTGLRIRLGDSTFLCDEVIFYVGCFLGTCKGA